MSMASRSLVVVLAGLLCGCGSADTADTALSGEAQLFIGTGLDTHTPLSDGDTLDVWLGPQGGHMLYACYHVSGIEPGDASDPNDPGNPKTTVRAYVGDKLVGVVNRRIGLAPVSPGVYGAVGTILVFKSSVPETTYLEKTVRLEIRVTDASGMVAESAVQVETEFAGEDDVEAPLL